MESEMKEMYNKSMEELCKLADDYRVKLDTVSDVFEELSDDDKIEIIFDYLDEQGEERPFSMDEFDDEMRGFTPSDIAMRITEDFNIQDEYFSSYSHMVILSSSEYLSFLFFICKHHLFRLACRSGIN